MMGQVLSCFLLEFSLENSALGSSLLPGAAPGMVTAQESPAGVSSCSLLGVEAGMGPSGLPGCGATLLPPILSSPGLCWTGGSASLVAWADVPLLPLL